MPRRRLASRILLVSQSRRLLLFKIYVAHVVGNRIFGAQELSSLLAQLFLIDRRDVSPIVDTSMISVLPPRSRMCLPSIRRSG